MCKFYIKRTTFLLILIVLHQCPTILWYFIFVYLISMSQIMFYFLHCISSLSFYIEIVLTPSIKNDKGFFFKIIQPGLIAFVARAHWQKHTRSDDSSNIYNIFYIMQQSVFTVLATSLRKISLKQVLHVPELQWRYFEFLSEAGLLKMFMSHNYAKIHIRISYSTFGKHRAYIMTKIN